MSFGSRQSPRTNREYIRNLIDQGHESVLEHAVWTFELSGITRAFTHQLVRHRVGFSFSQLSQQYVGHEDFQMLAPIDLAQHPGVSSAWTKARDVLRTAYRSIRDTLEKEIQREQFGSEKERRRFINNVARQVLPGAVSTRVMVTANARAIRHFLKLRGAIEGDPEMREVSTALLKTIKPEAPALFEDFDLVTLPDGLPAVVMRGIEQH
jgi:thymidylate synthase (FAD)